MYNYFNRDQIVHLFCCCCCQYLVREGGGDKYLHFHDTSTVHVSSLVISYLMLVLQYSHFATY